ncbi:MAG TPA: glycosyltransferase family 4 protein [Acidobacteriaceae bacterium]|nr:glycosyltransferase family 4 protein [Acidobacteriaceae bacterium]
MIEPPLPEEGAEASAPEGPVALLTGGFDRPYAYGLATALAARGVALEVIGADELDTPDLRSLPRLRFFNFYGDPRRRSQAGRWLQNLLVYLRILRYAAVARPGIFHILWNNRLQVFDRTLLMLYYKALGRKIVLTAHNVNAGRRDAADSRLNRWSLKAQYRLMDAVFVHTEAMKADLVSNYGVRKEVVSVIPFGINNSVPVTDLSCAEAKRRLGIGPEERAILFFGSIRPYKGVEFLVHAFQQIAARDPRYRLMIAGEPKKEAPRYWKDIEESIARGPASDRVIRHIDFIPDEDTELYFKAADVLVLPYTHVYQSGVLFLGYSFGLPVVAADVGTLRDDVEEGRTGFVCRPRDADDLAASLETYFASDLFRNLERRRAEIRAFSVQRNSWETVAATTCAVYRTLEKQHVR